MAVSQTQLVLLAGVFLSGAASGAVALSLTDDSRRPERPARVANSSERGARLSLEELRDALERLGVRVEDIEADGLEAPPRADALERVPSEVAATDEDHDAAEEGSSAGDVLARLEAEYRARLAEEKARLIEEEARRAQEESLQARRIEEERRAEEARQLEEERRAALAREPSAAEREKPSGDRPVELAKSDAPAGPVYNGPVHNGDRVTTEVNQVALYQSLFFYPGAVPNGPQNPAAPGARPPQAGRHRSAHEDSPWRPTDYGSHYSNPFGSTFSR